MRTAMPTEIIDHVSVEHRTMIAKRKKVPVAVADQLARRGEISVVKALLGNKGAPVMIIAVHAAKRGGKRDRCCYLWW